MKKDKNYEEILNSVEEKVDGVIANTAIPTDAVSKSLDADDIQKEDVKDENPEPPATEQEEAEMKEETATADEPAVTEEAPQENPEPPATEQEEAEMKEETATADEEVSKSVEEVPEVEAPAETEVEEAKEETPEVEAPVETEVEEVPEVEAPAEAEEDETVEKSMIPTDLVVKMFSHISEGLESIAKSLNSPQVAQLQETVEEVAETITKSVDTEVEDLEGKSVTYAPKETIAKSVDAEVAEVEEEVEVEAPAEEAFNEEAFVKEATDFFFGNVTRLNGDDEHNLRAYLMNANQGVTATQETVENIQRIIKL